MTENYTKYQENNKKKKKKIEKNINSTECWLIDRDLKQFSLHNQRHSRASLRYLGHLELRLFHKKILTV